MSCPHDVHALPAITLLRVDELAAQAILAGVARPGVRWASGYPAEGDIEAAALALRTMEVVGDSPFCCYEIANDDGLIVGGAGFHSPPGRDGVVEIGYGVAPSVRNRRFAQAAITELVAISRRAGVRRVIARTDPSNAPSRRALEACGFTTEAIDGEYVHLSLVCDRSSPAAPRS